MSVQKSWKGTLCTIVLCWAFLGNALAHSVIRCMSCKKASHIATCEEIEICNNDKQICFVEEEIDIGGELVVNAGCRNRTECDSTGCFGESIGARDIGGRVARGVDWGAMGQERDVRCHHCCDGDFCNMHGCPDTLDMEHLVSTRCFVCDNLLHPSHCTKVQNCETDQICVQQLYGFASEIRYSSGCMKKQMCDMMLKARSTARKKRNLILLESTCCDSHMCNGQLPVAEHEPSLYSASYKCPGKASSTEQPTTTEATLPTGNKASTERACADVVDCTQWEYEFICHGEYRDWSALNCRRHCGFCSGPSTEAPVTTIAASKSTSPTTTTAVCEDVDVDCADYGGYICEDYKEWSQIHCQRFCGFCVGSAAAKEVKRSVAHVSLTREVCVDVDPDCADYGRDYICVGDYIPWSELHCRKYCGLCQEVCTDKDPDCADYGRDYICAGDYIPWSQIHCQDYCGLCSATTQTPSTTSVPITKVTTPTPSTTSVPTTTVAATTTQPEVCEDVDSDCADYGRDYICVGDYIPWSQIHCRKYCGVCSVPQCTDVDTDCADYGRDYICVGDFIPWAQIHCQNYCGLCSGSATTQSTQATTTPTVTTTTTTTAVAVCEDNRNDCNEYSRELACTGMYLQWALENCPMFCGLCTEKVTTTTQSTTKTTVTTPTKPPTTTTTTPLPTTTEPTTTTTIPSTTTTETTTTPTTTTPTTTTPTTTTPTTTTPTTTTTTLPTTTPTATTLDPREACGDVEDCSKFHDLCNKPSEREWMFTHCRGTCKWCLDKPPCTDEISNCDAVGPTLCTDPMFASFVDQCKATCKLC